MKTRTAVYRIVALACLAVLSTTGIASAEIETPRILSAAFDGSGRLKVTATHAGAYAGCYLTINGGLSKSSVNIAIVGRQLTSSEATRGRAIIKTVRRYYCRQRSLYVNAELVCLSGEIAQKTSAVVKVSVPSANVRR